jgi:hypothetical protein
MGCKLYGNSDENGNIYFGRLGRIYTHVMRGFQNITPGIGDTYVNGILTA